MAEESKQPVPSFHQRFNIETSVDQARNHFINRIINKVEGSFLRLVNKYPAWRGYYIDAMYNAANKLGIEYRANFKFCDLARNSFYDCLKVTEAVYEVFSAHSTSQANNLSNLIQHAISLSEADLCIEWRNGVFWASGAKLLDQALVNENLKWLADKGYQDVLVPFEKGLGDFLEAIQKPERLADTVTDVYEAVEALAKRITGKERHLSENAELFVSKLKLGEYYKKMLKDYIKYANDYRHAAKLGKQKKPLLRHEVEAFIYTSGLFIRLAVQQSA